MAEMLRRRTRQRKVGTMKSVSQTEKLLTESMVGAAVIVKKIQKLQEALLAEEVVVSSYMEELKLPKFTSSLAEAVYDHPAQKTTNTFDTSGLFEDVTVEDFVASVKVQKGLAEKVIDPKILKKYMTSAKSELKPKTLKLKVK